MFPTIILYYLVNKYNPPENNALYNIGKDLYEGIDSSYIKKEDRKKIIKTGKRVPNWIKKLHNLFSLTYKWL